MLRNVTKKPRIVTKKVTNRNIRFFARVVTLRCLHLLRLFAPFCHKTTRRTQPARGLLVTVAPGSGWAGQAGPPGLRYRYTAPALALIPGKLPARWPGRPAKGGDKHGSTQQWRISIKLPTQNAPAVCGKWKAPWTMAGWHKMEISKLPKDRP